MKEPKLKKKLTEQIRIPATPIVYELLKILFLYSLVATIYGFIKNEDLINSVSMLILCVVIGIDLYITSRNKEKRAAFIEMYDDELIIRKIKRYKDALRYKDIAYRIKYTDVTDVVWDRTNHDLTFSGKMVVEEYYRWGFKKAKDTPNKTETMTTSVSLDTSKCVDANWRKRIEENSCLEVKSINDSHIRQFEEDDTIYDDYNEANNRENIYDVDADFKIRWAFFNGLLDFVTTIAVILILCFVLADLGVLKAVLIILFTLFTVAWFIPYDKKDKEETENEEGEPLKNTEEISEEDDTIEDYGDNMDEDINDWFPLTGLDLFIDKEGNICHLLNEDEYIILKNPRIIENQLNHIQVKFDGFEAEYSVFKYDVIYENIMKDAKYKFGANFPVTLRTIRDTIKSLLIPCLCLGVCLLFRYFGN